MIFLLTLLTPIIIGLYYLKIYYFNGGICTSSRRLDGKTVIVTGATSGIGKETARDFARRGANVIMAVRNLEKAKDVIKDIVETTGNKKVRAMKLELSSLKSVADFAKEFKKTNSRLDILVNNAGIIHSEQILTKDGIESMFQANYLGHFLLTMLLADVLKKSAPSRIVNVSSLAHKRSFIKKIYLNDLRDKGKTYGQNEAYGQSKLAQVISTRNLAKYFDKHGVTVYSLHPGVVRTALLGTYPYNFIGILYHIFNVFIMPYIGKSEEQGAQTSIYCAVEEGIEKQSGCYFSDCRQKKLEPHAMDDAAAEELWKKSLEMISPYYKL